MRKRSPVLIEEVQSNSEEAVSSASTSPRGILSFDDTFSMLDSEAYSEWDAFDELKAVKPASKEDLVSILKDVKLLRPTIDAISTKRSIRYAHPRDVPAMEFSFISSLVFGTYTKLPKKMQDQRLQILENRYDFYIGQMGSIMYKEALKKGRNDWGTLSGDQQRGVRVMANAALRTLEDIKDRYECLTREADMLEYELGLRERTNRLVV